MIIPGTQEVAPYDHPVLDALLHSGGEPLGYFSEKFEDTDESWSVWHNLLTGTYDEDDDDDDDHDDDDDEEEDEEEEEEMAGSGDAGGRCEHESNARKSRVHESACRASHEELNAVATQTDPSAKAGQPEADDGLIVEGGEKALREMVMQVVRKSCPEYYSSQGATLGRQAEDALSCFVSRLQQGRNARNALMLVRRTACHPLPPAPRPRPLCVAAIWQAYLKILIAGPMRSIRLTSEDLPPAAVKVAYECAAKTEEASGAWEAGEVREEELLLRHFMSDNQVLGGIAGWCLKFLFEGHDSLHDVARRRCAFVQVALEARYGPLKGVVVAGDNEWSWDDALVPCDGPLQAFAEAYGENFALAHGDTLGSILDDYLAALGEAGFRQGGWSCELWRPSTAEKSPSKRSPSKQVANTGLPEELPAFGELPMPALADLAQARPAPTACDGAVDSLSATSERTQVGAVVAPRLDALPVEAVGALVEAARLVEPDGLPGQGGADHREVARPATDGRHDQAPARDAVW